MSTSPTGSSDDMRSSLSLAEIVALLESCISIPSPSPGLLPTTFAPELLPFSPLSSSTFLSALFNLAPDVKVRSFSKEALSTSTQDPHNSQNMPIVISTNLYPLHFVLSEVVVGFVAWHWSHLVYVQQDPSWTNVAFAATSDERGGTRRAFQEEETQ